MSVVNISDRKTTKKGISLNRNRKKSHADLLKEAFRELDKINKSKYS